MIDNGLSINLGACLWIWIGCHNLESKGYEIFGVAFLLGSSSTTIQTSALSMIANLIGSDIGIKY